MPQCTIIFDVQAFHTRRTQCAVHHQYPENSLKAAQVLQGLLLENGGEVGLGDFVGAGSIAVYNPTFAQQIMLLAPIRNAESLSALGIQTDRLPCYAKIVIRSYRTITAPAVCAASAPITALWHVSPRHGKPRDAVRLLDAPPR